MGILIILFYIPFQNLIKAQCCLKLLGGTRDIRHEEHKTQIANQQGTAQNSNCPGTDFFGAPEKKTAFKE